MGLFKPGWMAEEYKKASASLKKVSDETVLRDAALRAPNHYVREEAIKKLWDCRRIVEVICAQGISVPRKDAVKRLMAVEPLSRVWEGLEKMDKESVARDAMLQSCIAAVARYAEGYGLRRKAARYLTDQATLKWLAAYDRDQGVRSIALARIDDQQYLMAAFNAADSDEMRLSAIANMRDTAPAARLARTAADSFTCAKALEKTGDPALALEIMSQTLNREVCEICVRLADINNVGDDWRRVLMALCGPEEARVEARRCVEDSVVFERIAMHDCLERFPSLYESSYLCEKALGYVTDGAALLRIFRGARERVVREKALKQIRDVGALLMLFDDDPLRYNDKQLFTRLDEIDGDWVSKAGNRTVDGLVKILSENTCDERFDYTHIANALKQIYGLGRATERIAGVQGIAVSHSDSSGRKNRSNGCHGDEGYTYLELDKI